MNAFVPILIFGLVVFAYGKAIHILTKSKGDQAIGFMLIFFLGPIGVWIVLANYGDDTHE